MKEIKIPESFNYIAVFLTFSCQLRCSYCINHHGGDLVKGRRMSPKEWIDGLNRLQTRSDLPITIQGGEPTVYRGFYDVVNGIKHSIPIDLLTNLEIDIEEFARSIQPDRLRRESKYASIRVSYHHGQSDFTRLCAKVVGLQRKGFSIGVWEVGHPEYYTDVLDRQHIANHMGIDWRIKEFLGPWKGKNYGTMRYDGAVNSNFLTTCDCRTSELLIDPSGNIFRCHSDLYSNRSSIGSILDDSFSSKDLGLWRSCSVYGKCNSCDIKIKTNRFQEGGHSSVEIKNIEERAIPILNTPIVNVENTYGKQ